MKLALVLALCGLAIVSTNATDPLSSVFGAFVKNDQTARRNWLEPIFPVLFETFRRLIKGGSPKIGLPVLDPLEIEKFDIAVPAEIINLNLDLEDVYAEGIHDFEVHNLRVDVKELYVDIDVSLPNLDMSTEHYDFIGDIFTAIPLYGKGKAKFVVDELRFKAKIFLGQSSNGKSIIIDRLENVGFKIGNVKSGLTGAIGGGDIDNIINALISEVFIDYVNRFEGALSAVISRRVPILLNGILEKYDSWTLIEDISRC